MTRNKGAAVNTECQIDGCNRRSEQRLMGVRLCWMCFLRIKVRAALDRTSYDIAA